MLILTKKLWETDHIIKIHCSDIWDNKDTYILIECVLQELKSLLLEAKDTQKPAILICDCNKGELPPLKNALQFAKFMVGIREIILEGLNFTIVYAKSETHKMWVDRILSFYTPAKPVHIVNNKEDLKKLIKQAQ